MKHSKLKKISYTSLFAALVCVATMVIHIPVPATGGYLNLGDAVVLLGALLLGPAYGFAAGGLGSMLADILSGYAQYAPGTLITKGLCAFTAAVLWNSLSARRPIRRIVSLLIVCAAAELVMTAGYFFYESLILGYGFTALAAVPGNLLQAAAGILLAIPLYMQLEKRISI